MPNVAHAGGFLPVDNFSGGYHGKVRKYKKEASVILAEGDAVVLTGSAEAVTGIALIDRAAAASGTITGVVVGVDYDPQDLFRANYLRAADTGYVYVLDDPSAHFYLQEDSVGGALAVTDVGRGADIAVSNADTTFGKSNMLLDSSTAGQAQVQILELAQLEGNEIGNYATWRVRINEHTFNATATLI